MKKLFLIIGAPGSGKTTDAAMIAQKSNGVIAHYSTGDLLRAEVSSGSERGKIIDSFISKGLIVPIEIAIDTITSAIKASSSDVILFDGYPRSHEQMTELDAYLSKDHTIVLLSVIEVVVSEAVARDRVLGRARGADDDERVFNNRMLVYTDPLADIQTFYQSHELLHKIDGERSLEAIVDDMESFINFKLQSHRN